MQQALENAFCSSFSVNAVPAGYAVSTPFLDRDGDPISFYAIEQDGEGYRLEDDSFYLGDLVGRGIDIDRGQRLSLLESIVEGAGAYVDLESYEILTETFGISDLPRRMVDFTSVLLRIRDVELITREVVASTFREDVASLLNQRFGEMAEIDGPGSALPNLPDFPTDFVLRPRGSDSDFVAVYTVTQKDRLNEALLLHQELRIRNDTRKSVVALVESRDSPLVRSTAFQRAQNRRLPLPIFRGDEDASIDVIEEKMFAHVA